MSFYSIIIIIFIYIRDELIYRLFSIYVYACMLFLLSLLAILPVLDTSWPHQGHTNVENILYLHLHFYCYYYSLPALAILLD